jgi:glycolate oxidase iron-sulfur subunit
VNQCPVYRELKEEIVSPRAKIRLIKAQMAGELKNDKVLRKILTNCLMCETCFKNCPSGLHAAEAIGELRGEFRKKYGLDWKKKLLKFGLNNNRLKSLSAFWGRIIYNNFISKLPLPAIPAGALSIKNIPKISPALKKTGISGTTPKKVLYFVGCLDRHMFSNTATATIKLLNKLGYDVEISDKEKCCGMPLLISGDKGSVLPHARKNLDLMTGRHYDHIVTACPTCAVALKLKYPEIFKDLDPVYYKKAVEAAGRISDVVGFLSKRGGLKGLLKEQKASVTYHDPCHLVNSLGLFNEPRELIKAAPGVKFTELKDAPSCCGSGGFYHVYFPSIAKKIGRKKAADIRATGADIVLTACPACMLQLINFVKNDKIPARVMHLSEFLAERI